MPIVRPKGLKGLEGIGSLSKADYDSFVNNNKALISAHNYDPVYINNLYSNKQFIDRFSIEDFKSIPDIEMRNKLYKDAVVNDAFNDVFKSDKDYNLLANQLDTQGKLDLLNSDYMGTVERQKRLASGIQAANRLSGDFKAASSSPFIDVLQIGQNEETKTAANSFPIRRDEDYAQKDKELREKLFADTQERRETEVNDLTNNIYANILNLDDTGQKSLDKSYTEFDKWATENSPYYQEFKNSKWLEGYSHEDRLKDYAKYQALASTYGEGMAKTYFDRTIQNKVAEAQDGKWTGNTLKKVATTTWSDLGSNIAVLSHLGESAERIAIWNQGKNPDKLDYNKPIKDRNGKVIGYDYADNDNLLTNPAYWNDVYKYNTFSPTEIKAINERGGVSEDVNVRAYGYTPDFLSWDTAEEGFAQVGNTIGTWGLTYGLGLAGKGLGLAGKMFMKAAGLSSKAMSRASKIGALTNDLVVGASTGISGAQLESMGTFEEQLQNNKEKIKDQIEHALHDYSRTIDYNSKEARAAINSYYNQLKKQDQRRVASSVGENTKAFPLNDETLKAQAKQMYANQLLDAKQKELEDIHRPDEKEAEKNAAKTYMTNFIMDYLKEVPITTGIQQFKIAKGSMKGAFDNTLKKELVGDAATGGVKRAERGAKKASSWLTKPIVGTQNFLDKHRQVREVLKQIGGGFADEYLDGLNASFSEGIGNADFNNYINKTYNPENYNAVVDTMLGNLLSGMSAGVDGITDRQNLYEGFIGAISPFVATAVNPAAVFSPHDTWNAVVHGVDEKGNQLNKRERLARVVNNPLVSSYADMKEKDRQVDSAIEAINSVVSANKDKLDVAAKTLAALNDYSSPIVNVRIGGEEGERETPSLLDSQDEKLFNVFTLIDALNVLEKMDGADKATSYRQAMDTIEGLANGSLSEDEMNEEVDKFLADPTNKSVLDEGSEAARQTATERLQKNAQYFMDMKQKMSEMDETFAKSPSMKNVDPRVKAILEYNLVASDDYKKRLETLEDELGVTKTDADEMYTPNLSARYGTAAARESAISARDKVINNLQKKQEEVQKQIDENEEKLKDLRSSIKSGTAEDEEKTAIQLQRRENMAAALNMQWNTLEQSKKKAKAEQSSLRQLTSDSNGADTVLSEEEILNLDARDRWEMLNIKNLKNYPEKQQAIIVHTIQNLAHKDPEALVKLQDAATLAYRISDLSEMYSKMMDNHPLAAAHLDAVEQLRTETAYAEGVQQVLDKHSADIEKAYAEREANPQGLKDAVLNTGFSSIMDTYLEEHPEQEDVIRPYIDLLRYSEDAKSVVNSSSYDNAQKKAILETLNNMLQNSNSKEEAYNYLEGIVDSEDLDEATKSQYNDLLASMENLGHHRDATITEARAERKQREEAARKAEEEEKRKLEEERKKNEEAANEASGANLDASSVEDVDLGIEDETPASTTPQASTPTNASAPTSKKASDNIEVTPEEGAQLHEESNTTPASLMDGDKDGSIEAGTISYGSTKDVKQGNYTVTRKANHITFSVDNKKQSLALSNKDWQYSEDKDGVIGITKDFTATTSDGRELKANELRNTPFSANRIFKGIDGKWYAEGQFKVQNGNLIENVNAIVELKEGFNLEETVGRYVEDTNVLYALKSDKVKDPHLTEDADTVTGTSVDIDGQVAESNGKREQEVSEVTTDAELVNETTTQAQENSATSLSGNAMSAYNMTPLIEDGILERKKGASPTDNMSKFFSWMDAAGIKLQNIIDEELGLILQKTPHAKVKFMVVRPQTNATHDDYMKTHLLLVLDYDNSVNKGITNIHKDSNGGVIESEGKKYLVIGVAGFGDYNKAKSNGRLVLWDTLFSNNPKVSKTNPVGYGLVKKGQGNFFNNNPSERFYVAPNLSTEIVPQSLIPGYRVRQLETDDNPEYRSVKDLLKDKDRNPNGNPETDTLSDMAWGIQEYTKFLVVGTSLDKVMIPRSVDKNAGNAFVLIPAGNGKLLPAYLKPLFYTEMQDGALKDKATQLLQDLSSPNYATRLKAVIELSKIFHFNKDGNTILLRKNKAEVSFVKDGKVFKTFALNSGFDRRAFEQAFADMNPRVNITAAVLHDNTSLNEYEEAGALMTDVAKLNTAGSSYSIYGLTPEGKTVVPNTTTNDNVPVSEGTERENNKMQIPFKGEYYRESNGEYTLNGKPVTDAKVLMQLRVNRRVLTEGLAPVETNGAWQYYLVGTNDKPEAFRINKNTKEAEFLPNEEAHRLADKIHKYEEAARKAESAREALENPVGTPEDVDLGLDAEPEATAEIANPVEQAVEEAIKGEGKEQLEEKSATVPEAKETPIEEVEALEKGRGSGKAIGLTEHLKDKGFRQRVMAIVKKKWPNAPKKLSELEAFLKEKNMNVSSIGTSNEDIDSWIRTLEDCR